MSLGDCKLEKWTPLILLICRFRSKPFHAGEAGAWPFLLKTSGSEGFERIN